MSETDDKKADGRIIPMARRRRCPICGASTEHAYRPFCSQRCADQDLGRWLTGVYRIPDDEEAGFDDDQGGEGT